MNRRLVFWIALGVLAAHGAVFWAVRDSRPIPRYEHIPPPNFNARATSFVDPQSGEKMTVQEFTVSTRLREDLSHTAPEQKQR